MKAVGEDGKEVRKEIDFYCLNSFTDSKGVFVLNEGNMTTENGSLTYITPEGYVIGDAYKKVNGTELGNVAQDMAFAMARFMSSLRMEMKIRSVQSLRMTVC